MDRLMLFLVIPVIVRVRETAMIDEANGGIDPTNVRSRSAWESVRFDDPTERVFSRKVVVE